MNGLLKLERTFQAFLFSCEDGSSVLIGTKDGKIRAPSLYLSSGNGALYAAMILLGTSFLHPIAMILPTSKLSTSNENLRQFKKASEIGLSPVANPVLATMALLKRSGSFASNLKGIRNIPVDQAKL